jgi:hypothetical protein
MEAAILCIIVAALYSIVGLALIVLPRRFGVDRGENLALDDARMDQLKEVIVA